MQTIYSARLGVGVSVTCEPLTPLESCRALLLDRSYRPLRAVGWRRAVCLDLAERVEVLEYYLREVRTASTSFPIPAVIRAPTWLHRRKAGVPPTRRNILLRDGFQCAYCGRKGTSAELTVDHVMPRSRGGITAWTNVVTACAPCNRHKGSRTPEEAGTPLSKSPRAPCALQLGRRGMVVGDTPSEWGHYL